MRRCDDARCGVRPAHLTLSHQPSHSLTPLCDPVMQSPIRVPQSPIRVPQSPIRVPQSAIRNPQSPIRVPQSPIRNPQSPIRNPQSPIRVPQSAFRNPQSAIRNPQSPIPNPTSLILLAAGRSGPRRSGRISRRRGRRWPPGETAGGRGSIRPFPGRARRGRRR